MRSDIFYLTIDKLLKTRLHLGHKANLLNKFMLSYIVGNRHNISIFNLEKIIYNLRIIYNALVEIVMQRSYFFLVGNDKNMVMDKFLIHYMKNLKKKNFLITGYTFKRWVGGIFSNRHNIEYFINYMLKSSKKNSKRYSNYLKRLKGINTFSHIKIPDYILLLNLNKEALNESSLLDIPAIGITDSNVNISSFLYTLPGNDDSIESIQFFNNIIEEAIKEGFYKEQEQFIYYFLFKIKNNLKK